MRPSRVFVPGVLAASLLVTALTFHTSLLHAQEAASSAAQSPRAEQQQQSQEPKAQDQRADDQQQAAPVYDKAIFQNPISADHLAFLRHFDGQSSDKLFRDK